MGALHRLSRFGPLLFLPWVCFAGASGEAAWSELSLRSSDGQLYGASSSLKGYGPRRLFDGSLNTCWAEGAAGQGVGERLYVGSVRPPAAFEIVNGYAKSPRLFKANGRIKEAGLSVFVGINRPGRVTETEDLFEIRPLTEERLVGLKDVSVRQEVRLPFHPAELSAAKDAALAAFVLENKLSSTAGLTVRYLLEIRIAEAVPGRKYKDTCVSELRIVETGSAAGPVSRVFEDGEHAVVMERAGGERADLIRDPGSVFQIVEVSRDKRWAILIRMPAEAEGRVETEYRLYDLAARRRVPERELGRDLDAMYGFVMKGGKLFLDGTEAGTMEGVRVDLDALAAPPLNKEVTP